MMALVEVGAGGLVGAPARLVVDQVISARRTGEFPWGTYVVNVTGAFLLGLVTGLVLYQGLGHAPSAVIGTGFCGGYTTFSTFSWETVRLMEEGRLNAAMRNLAGSLMAGLAAAAAGLAIAYVA